jgi:hypothetical protein
MMQQVRFCLGPEVQAVRMNVVTGPPADTQGEAYAPGADPAAYAKFAENIPENIPGLDPDKIRPPEEFAPGKPRKQRCNGSGEPPDADTVRFRNVEPTADNPGYNQGRGRCAECGGQFKLTHAGNVRVHYIKA